MERTQRWQTEQAAAGRSERAIAFASVVGWSILVLHLIATIIVLASGGSWWGLLTLLQGIALTTLFVTLSSIGDHLLDVKALLRLDRTEET